MVQRPETPSGLVNEPTLFILATSLVLRIELIPSQALTSRFHTIIVPLQLKN